MSESNEKIKNVLLAGAAGAALGAAATAAGMVLSKKENRDKLSKGFDEIKAKGGQAVAKFNRKASQTLEDWSGKADELTDDLKDTSSKLS